MLVNLEVSVIEINGFSHKYYATFQKCFASEANTDGKNQEKSNSKFHWRYLKVKERK